MERKIMGDIAERLTHYEAKCSEHLNRVRLSHLLALKALEDKPFLSDEKFKHIIRASFVDIEPDKDLAKLRLVLHKLHLLSLKISFELFLNRVLSTVWKFHFTELAPTISGQVYLSELAASIVEPGESSADLREFIIDKVVWNHGLVHFEKVLKSATQIQLHDVLNAKDFHYWPQIYTAFEARHLVEHRDGKVDGRFREAIAGFWPNSSWGRRTNLEGLEKVVVEEEDVVATLDAMLNATALLTGELLRWSSI
jgi:hypothetical protein